MIQDKILPTTNQNLVKSRFPYIDKFGCTKLAVVCAMWDLTNGVFEHLELSSHFVNKRVNCMQRLIMGPEVKKYKTVLVESK